MSATDTLITPTEAEEVVAAPKTVTAKLRSPALIVLGILIVVVATLILLVLLSLRGSRTGWETILPFLDKKETRGLQTD